ncbi:hypothetical protein KSP40_PGU001362 [Platanthera guangdongensis]|uniref:Uncharacterized protein n=1 Tax=Platanthera guangdongensis TaxID=2320717 RepID=A0ABR2MPP1_9ASPA
MAADIVYPGKKFTKYAILGDDFIIADHCVGQISMNLLETIGVQFSPQKYQLSSTGCIEFAKRFLVNNLKTDFSSVSVGLYNGLIVDPARSVPSCFAAWLCMAQDYPGLTENYDGWSQLERLYRMFV